MVMHCDYQQHGPVSCGCGVEDYDMDGDGTPDCPHFELLARVGWDRALDLAWLVVC